MTGSPGRAGHRSGLTSSNRWRPTPGTSSTASRCSSNAPCWTGSRPRPAEPTPTRGARCSHDRWVWFLAATFGRIVVLRDILAEYRQHDAQLFGGAEDRTFRERIATKLSAGRAQARYLAGVAAHRGYLLESRMPDRDNVRWRAGAAHWRTLEARMADRARLYDPLPAGERIRLLAAGAKGGTYRAFRHGGLGAGGFAEDVTVSILIGSRRRRQVYHR